MIILGLGGYWTIDNQNQRVWISDSVKFDSSPMLPTISKMVTADELLNSTRNYRDDHLFQQQQNKKSNSLGNFEFIQNNSQSEQYLDEGSQHLIQTDSRSKGSW